MRHAEKRPQTGQAWGRQSLRPVGTVFAPADQLASWVLFHVVGYSPWRFAQPPNGKPRKGVDSMAGVGTQKVFENDRVIVLVRIDNNQPDTPVSGAVVF